ncbi:MAG: DUF3445 domain-containing protein [Acidiferrobacterales bacterium]
MTVTSAQTASYFPLCSGRYEVNPGLFPFGTDFGNAAADEKIFQIDTEFARYRTAKLRARSERLSKYYCLHHYTSAVARKITDFIARRLAREYPLWFTLTDDVAGRTDFYCALTHERLVFDAGMTLSDIQFENQRVVPLYASALDALCCQIQEDVAVISRTGSNWLSAIHLCYPNHWAAEHKIGKDFASIHEPVPGFGKINAKAIALVDAMINKGPYVRFAWGLSTDARLNHHPVPPPGIPLGHWQGRHFRKDESKLFLRVERQTIWGFPEVSAALFTIRTYITDCRSCKTSSDKLIKLESAIESMTTESLTYKGLVSAKADILSWLRKQF